MKLMMVCPTCNMRGEVIKETITRSFYYEKCPDCHGKAVVEPPQQVLDDLECAEIERELLSKGYHVSVNQFEYSEKLSLCLTVHDGKELIFSIFNEYKETKLEALRKAKEYLDGRGVE